MGNKEQGCFACEHSEVSVPSFIFETQYWNIFLHPEQSYLGRCVVVLKTHKGALPELSKEEWDDLRKVIEKLEQAVKEGLGATMCNWACLMNDAYQEVNPAPHVHWHLRPRYDKNVIVNGKTFEDPDFGHHYNRDRKENVDEEMVKIIASKIKNALQVNLRQMGL